MLDLCPVIDKLEKWLAVNDIPYDRLDMTSTSSDPSRTCHAITGDRELWKVWMDYNLDLDKVRYKNKDGEITDLTYEEVVARIKEIYSLSVIIENKPWAIPED
jgi:hypothetical protein